MRHAPLVVLSTLLLVSCTKSPEAALKEELAEANYCDTEADCTLIGSKCPFDCYVYVNSAEANEMKGKLDAYQSTCEYSCLQSFGVACNQNKCEPILDEPQAADEEGNVGASCSTDEECITPMSYMIRSSCPYTSMCIDGACSVVCPMWEHDSDPEVSKSYPVACEEDSDCTCDQFSSDGECSCVNNACVSIVSE